MSLSVTNPVEPCIQRAKRICFEPFDFGKWAGLGFCAWLSMLGQNRGASFQLPGNGLPSGNQIEQFVHDNLPLIIGGAILLGLLVVVLMILTTWLSSRGKFMFIDGIVHNRGLVKAPWAHYRELGNSLFGFRVMLSLAALVLLGGIAGAVGFVVYQQVIATRGSMSPAAIAVLVAGIAVFLILVIVFSLVNLGVHDFVVPIMYARNLRIRSAWDVVRPVLRDNVGAIALYVLFKILLGMGVAMIATLVMLVTCCLAALPYVGTVVMLPLFVFMQAYPLQFLHQLGPDFSVFQSGTGVVETFE